MIVFVSEQTTACELRISLVGSEMCISGSHRLARAYGMAWMVRLLLVKLLTTCTRWYLVLTSLEVPELVQFY